MTQAQRDAMYGKNNPNAPQKTSGQSQAQAEAKQRQLERERQHQQALGQRYRSHRLRQDRPGFRQCEQQHHSRSGFGRGSSRTA